MLVLAVLIASNVVYAWALALIHMAKIACKLGHIVNVDDVRFKPTCIEIIIEINNYVIK